MAQGQDYRHHLNVRSTQLELRPDNYTSQSKTPEELERMMAEIAREKAEMERKAKELEEISSRKKIFLHSQVESSEKLTNAITLIERELLAMRNEMSDLEQTRGAFDASLKKITKLDPDLWADYEMLENLDKALAIVDQGNEEYDQAARYFSGMRSSEIFGKAKRNKKHAAASDGEFFHQLKNGFAFNLPIITVAIIALLIYLTK